MKKILIFLVIISAIFIVPPSVIFAAEPPLIDQAIWSETTKDKVFNACLAAVTMVGYAVDPLGTNKDIGLIITKPISFNYKYRDDIVCYYTLQIVVTEIQHNKVMVNVNAVDKNYDWKSYNPGESVMQGYFDNKIAPDFQKFFAQIDNVLGKAESYRKK